MGNVILGFVRRPLSAPLLQMKKLQIDYFMLFIM